MAEDFAGTIPLNTPADIPAQSRPDGRISHVAIDLDNRTITMRVKLGEDVAGEFVPKGGEKIITFDNPQQDGLPFGTQWFDGIANGQLIDGTLCSGKRFAKLLKWAAAAKGELDW